jgi:hypothetical protein
MQKFAKIFPAKVRRIVASQDWSDGSIYIDHEGHYGTTRAQVCPIGLALRHTVSAESLEPTASRAAILVRNHANDLNTSAIPHEQQDLYDWFDDFMNLFDNHRLTNQEIADIFGYPELAQV